MDHDQILEMVKRVRKVAAEELKGNQHKLDMNKNGKLDAKDFEHLRKMKEESEKVEEAMSPQAKTTMKHIKNPTAGEKKAAQDIRPGVKGGYSDRIAMLHSAKARGALKNEEVDLDEVMEGQLRNFSPHSDLAGRGRLPSYNKTAAGKKREADRETERLKDKMKFTKSQGGIAGPKGKLPEEAELDEAKAAPGSPFSKNYKSQMPDDQKTSTKTYHDVKKTSTGTVYTKQSDAEGISKGTGDDAAKASEPKEKRGRGRPVGSKSGARQAGAASKTDYRGFVTHTLNLPASR